MSDNLELSVSITTEEPEVAANLDELRFLVFQGKKGDTGDSAYEEAVSLGFVGTEAEWLASLKGAKGDTGYSPEIRVTDISGGHRLDIYNELGYETVDVMDGIDGEDGEDGVSPAVAVTDIAGGHRVTITDATHPQGQSFDVMNGSGIPDDVKQALLALFNAIQIGWNVDNARELIAELEAALYPPKTLVSISAVFTQGSAVIYDTDSLDTLKQYLTVTAIYDDTSMGVVTNYTLSGTLTEGTSTITVLYNGKTTTFSVTVTEYSPLPSGYTKINGVHGNGSAYVKTNVQVPLGYSVKVKARAYAAPTGGASVVVGSDRVNPSTQKIVYLAYLSLSKSANWIGCWYGGSDNFFSLQNLYSNAVETQTTFKTTESVFNAQNSDGSNSATVAYSNNSPSTALHLSLFYSGDASGYKFTGDILGVEVLDDSNNTSETFIPAKRDSDNVVGFYALTEDEFYPSDTSTPFTAVA